MIAICGWPRFEVCCCCGCGFAQGLISTAFGLKTKLTVLGLTDLVAGSMSGKCLSSYNKEKHD